MCNKSGVLSNEPSLVPPHPQLPKHYPGEMKLPGSSKRMGTEPLGSCPSPWIPNKCSTPCSAALPFIFQTPRWQPRDLPPTCMPDSPEEKHGKKIVQTSEGWKSAWDSMEDGGQSYILLCEECVKVNGNTVGGKFSHLDLWFPLSFRMKITKIHRACHKLLKSSQEQEGIWKMTIVYSHPDFQWNSNLTNWQLHNTWQAS